MPTSRRQLLRNLSLLGGAGFIARPQDLLAMTPELAWSEPINGMVRLSSNENPYSPSDSMKTAINAAHAKLCRYPRSGELESLIASQVGVKPENVVVTSGSREGLKAAGLLYGRNGGEILTCLPTYRALLTYAEQFGAYINVVPLDEDLQFNLEGLQRRISANTNMVFVCNPNNPTGRLLDRDRMKGFVKSAAERTMVFVDEVYFDYIEETNYPSMAPLVMDGYNVIISRTFSKVYGLAGIRVGYLIAREDIATRLRESLMSGTNAMALELAKTALADEDFKTYCLDKNRQAKQMIYEALQAHSMEYLESHTNFVFFKTGRPIEEIQEAFKDQGVLVGRPFPPFLDWCRISTGTIEEVAAFTKAFAKVFA